MTALLFLLATPTTGRADGSPPGEERPPAELFENEFSALDLFARFRELRPRLSLRSESVIRQPHDDAEVDSHTLQLRSSVTAPVSRAVVLRTTASIESNLSDFHGDRDFLDTGRRSGPPFDELLSNRLTLEGRYAFHEDWALLGGVGYESSWERGARYADGIDLDGVLGIAHIFGDDVSIVAGARAGGRPGGGVSFSPVVRLGWRVTDDIEIETENIGLRVAARLNESLTLYLRGQYASDTWALEDRGGAVGRGRLQDRRVPVVVGARWKLSKRWRLRGFVGAIAYQKYRVRDDDGDTFDTERSHGPAFTFQTRVDYRF